LRTLTLNPQPSDASAPASVAPIFFGVFQGRINQTLKKVAAVAETVMRMRVVCLGRGLGSLGLGFFHHLRRIRQNSRLFKIHSEGYDTCRPAEKA
jgi:hypothetical protein